MLKTIYSIQMYRFFMNGKKLWIQFWSDRDKQRKKITV